MSILKLQWYENHRSQTAQTHSQIQMDSDLPLARVGGLALGPGRDPSLHALVL